MRRCKSGGAAGESARGAGGVRRRGVARLRSAYFSQAAGSAGRYGISFDDILEHLWHARCGERGRLPLRAVRYLDDLVLVVACSQRRSVAWADLVERYEPQLVRRCSERAGEIDALLLVRRTLWSLRHQHDGFADYVGDRQLRSWLAERVLSQLHPRYSAWCRIGNGATPPRNGRTVRGRSGRSAYAGETPPLRFPAGGGM